MPKTDGPIRGQLLEHISSAEEVTLAQIYSFFNASDKLSQAKIRGNLNFLVNTKKIARARKGVYVAIEGVSDENSS